MDDTIVFYFSFRSPYAWFAAERWHAVLGDLHPTVVRVPVYPTPETFPNDPTLLPAKLAHVLQDVVRLVRDFDLALRPPPAIDTDWARAHAAFYGVQADEPARAEVFMLEMFRARFSRGLDVALDEVIADAAERAGVDPQLATAAAAQPVFQGLVAGNMLTGQQRDGIFGVPSFVHRGQLYWGHDRMHHLRQALLQGANAAAQATG